MNKSQHPKYRWDVEDFNDGSVWLTVYVYAWHDGSRWRWNIYATAHSPTREATAVRALRAIDWHGGETFSETKTTVPLGGIRYDFQRRVTIHTTGCDYTHCGDEGNYDDNPVNGLPEWADTAARDAMRAMRNALPEAHHE